MSEALAVAGQCSATTNPGSQCRKVCRDGSWYCGTYDPGAEEAGEAYDGLGVSEDELRNDRGTLTLAQALTYFSGNVGASTLKNYYIKGKRLPEGVDVPLPARKVGNAYFVERETLEAWLMGRTTEADLYPWQKRRISGTQEG